MTPSTDQRRGRLLTVGTWSAGVSAFVGGGLVLLLVDQREGASAAAYGLALLILGGSAAAALLLAWNGRSSGRLETQRRHQEAIQERVRLAVFVRDVGIALTQADGVPDMLRRCTEAMVHHLDGAFARVWTVNDAGDVLELKASSGLYTHLDGPHSRVPVGQFKIGLIAQERQPHLTNAVVGDPRVPQQEWARREGLVAFAGYPLIVAERLVGVMAMFARQPLSEATLEAMASVANGLALGIERQRAEEQLHQQREWFRVTLGSIGDAVIATDTAGRVTFVNPVAAALTGWTSHEAEGRLLEEVFPILNEQSRAPVENPVAKALREGRPVGLANHTVLLGRDGRETPIDDSAAPIRDEQGRVRGVVLVFRDVAEKRRAEVALRASEARKAAILETALDSIVTCDHRGHVLEFNPAAERMFGYDRAAILGHDMGDLFVPPQLRNAHRQGMARYLAEGVGRILNQRLEMPACRADGTEFQVELAVTAIEGDGPPLFTAYLRDITARQLAEKRLQEETRISETLYRIGGTLAAELDPERLVQAVTDEATRITNAEFGAFFYNVQDRQGESYLLYTLSGVSKEAFAQFSMPRNTAVFEPTFRGEGSVRLDDVTRDPRFGQNAPHHGMPPGHLPVRSYLAVSVTSRSGGVLGGLFFGHSEVGVFSARDERVVEGIAAQAAIALDNARLYQEARSAGEQLRQRNEELAAASRHKDEFLAMLAHELRNPLAPLRNALHILKAARAEPVAIERAIQMMGRQVDTLVRLVDDLLDVSRITRGKIELRKERIELSTVLRRAVETARPVIEAQEHQLAVALPDEPIHLNADLTRLEQVVANLLNNAAKYTERGGRIWLSARREGSEAVIRVRDTGIGIPPEFLPRLFDLFSQAERSLDRAQGGLGIGLALVKNLIGMHGGSVEARSDGPGKGSEFVVRLPLLKAEGGRMKDEG